MEILDRNGKPLHGAAKQAVLSKRYGLNGWNPDEVTISIVSFEDRIRRLERRIKYLPVTVVCALFLGCAVGKIVKPDLVAVAIGCGSAGAGMAVAISRQ
jgi:hypothetical protein